MSLIYFKQGHFYFRVINKLVTVVLITIFSTCIITILGMFKLKVKLKEQTHKFVYIMNYQFLHEIYVISISTSELKTFVYYLFFFLLKF